MYKTLFHIKMLHDFYIDGICRGLQISPTPQCKLSLKNHRILFKETNTGFKICFNAIDEAGNPIINISDQIFSFIITVNDYAKFLNITDLTIDTKQYTGNKILYYMNDPINTRSLSSSFIDYIKPKNFVYNFPAKADDPDTNRASFEILDSEGQNVLGPFTSIKPNNQGYYSYKIDLTKYPKGRYIFKTSYDTTGTTLQEIVFIDNYLATKEIFGLVDINYNSGILADYDLQFIKKETYWKYLVVNKSGNIDLNTYDLKIKDTNTDKVGPYKETYNFSKGPEPDPVIKVNGYDTVVFTSDDQIPYYEIPVENIALMRVESSEGSTEETVILTNLPNPNHSGISNANNEAEIFVFI